MKLMILAAVLAAFALCTTATATANSAPTLNEFPYPASSLDTAVRKGGGGGGGGGGGVGASVGVDFSIDVVEMSKAIARAAKSARNRGAFVRNVLNTVYFEAGQRYNVMVFNLAVAHRSRLSGVQYYKSRKYNGLIYGIWVFKGGEFYNQGDGGFINWAFRGCVTGRVRGLVRFQSPSGKGRCLRVRTPPKLCIPAEQRCDKTSQCCGRGRRCRRKGFGAKRCY